MAPTKLRDLVRSIRACKTAAQEREVVQKECAQIRNGFRAEDKEYRARHVAKLLYIHMLGYPAHFGQLECLKLVTSSRFSDKRIGYLATMMLLDESKEVTMLVTNSLQMDLNHQTQYVSGLALCCFGAIMSEAMARDLSGEVQKLIKSSNSYIRKKAVLCAVRIIRKVPELTEDFIPATRSLLDERNHGVLLTGVTLIHEMCTTYPDSVTHFKRVIPKLIKILKSLITSSYSSDHDVGGVTDPFLQARILQLLRKLGLQDAEASERMSVILPQVTTNTESTKNVGNAILYEAVKCIMEMDAESALRLMGITTLGKFLTNKDRNIRYVALTMLLRTVQNGQADAVQRHRATIIDCLREPDITIRRRALALTFALISPSNVTALVGELLSFLEVADEEFKGYMTTELLKCSARFAPDRQWHIDTVLKVLTSAGTYLTEDNITTVVALFADSPQLQGYIVKQLYQALKASFVVQPLTQVGVWCIGEYGDLLLAPDATGADTPAAGTVLDLLQYILSSTVTLRATREYALTAVMKLSARIGGEDARIRAIIGKYSNHVDEELQQRAVE